MSVTRFTKKPIQVGGRHRNSLAGKTLMLEFGGSQILITAPSVAGLEKVARLIDPCMEIDLSLVDKTRILREEDVAPFLKERLPKYLLSIKKEFTVTGVHKALASLGVRCDPRTVRATIRRMVNEGKLTPTENHKYQVTK
jgi:hypothetical protein